jgi:3,4-dihydroxy 2-butanone 4-phosphate synthase/GTP cyclohydrolase II
MNTVGDAIAAISRGEVVVVVDDDAISGALVMAADGAIPERLDFLADHTAGLISAPVAEARGDELDPQLTAPPGEDLAGLHGVVDLTHQPAAGNGRGPVHVLRTRAGGVLERPAHAEAAVDLARLAGRRPAALLGEVAAEGVGTTVETFAADHGLVMISVMELIAYRWRTEKLIRRVAEARIPTEWGEFTAHAYENVLNGDEHVAFVMGAVRGQSNVLVRVHSECLTGDVFGSLKCDCGAQLAAAMGRIAGEGRGVLVYLRGHEGRGIGIAHKLQAYALQDQGFDTVDANTELGLPVDSREYGIGAQILVDLGITTMRYMTNNPAKYGGLEGFGLEMAERVALDTEPTPENIAYLRAKKERMGHLIDLGDDALAPLGQRPDADA